MAAKNVAQYVFLTLVRVAALANVTGTAPELVQAHAEITACPSARPHATDAQLNVAEDVNNHVPQVAGLAMVVVQRHVVRVVEAAQVLAQLLAVVPAPQHAAKTVLDHAGQDVLVAEDAPDVEALVLVSVEMYARRIALPHAGLDAIAHVLDAAHNVPTLV